MRLRLIALTTLTTFAFLTSACAHHDRERERHGAMEGRGPMGQAGSMAQSSQMLVPGGMLFLQFDADRDYSISAEEVRTGLAAAFAAADTDKSGTLSLFEYKDWSRLALGSDLVLPDWMSVDRNENRTITEAEFDAAFLRIAGRLGLSEETPLNFAALVREVQPSFGGGGGSAAPGGRGGRSGGPGGGGRPPRAA